MGFAENFYTAEYRYLNIDIYRKEMHLEKKR